MNEENTEDKTPEEIASQLWCLPQHSHKVMDAEFCASIVEVIKAERQARQKAEEEIKRLNKLINPNSLNVFDILDVKNIKKEEVWPFIMAAGNGCISGSVSEWPQLKPAIKWARHEIVKLEDLVRKLSQALEDINNEEMVASGLVNLVRVKQIAQEALSSLPPELRGGEK